MSTWVYSNWIETTAENSGDVARHPLDLELFLANHLIKVSASSTAAGKIGRIHRISSEDGEIDGTHYNFPQTQETRNFVSNLFTINCPSERGIEIVRLLSGFYRQRGYEEVTAAETCKWE